jgi:hypothetical protein
MDLETQKGIVLYSRIFTRACSHVPLSLRPKILSSWFAAHSLDNSAPGLDFELSDGTTAFLSGLDIVMPEKEQRLAFNHFLVSI